MIKDALRPRYVFVSSPGFVRQPLSVRASRCSRPSGSITQNNRKGCLAQCSLPASSVRRRGQPLGGYARCATMVILDHADW